ncbi:hypothetical protein ES288_A06G206700v1 [Gossypium darwinii]|uniref:DUF7653 domain-containing protein n=1 Tax=Gossypium darwinii TaxID=34276 RepID=A0A5D2G9R5_GOSDA|nr:hypothetical protein ES288_A06G206700v1 [Gossypium darwinii]
MKKLYFLKSFSSNDDIHVDFSPSANKQVYWENTSENGFDDQHGGNEAEHSFCSPKHLSGKSQKQISDSLSFSNDSCLQRSGSFSSATFIVDDLNKLSNVNQHQQYDHSLAIGFEKPCSSVSLRLHYDSSRSSSSCSGNVSSKVIDCYIDGERQPERYKCRDCSKRNIGNGGGRLLPRVRYASPSYPTGGAEEKNMSDSVESGFEHESPQMIKKNVIGRLSQTHAIPISSSKEFDCCIPITTEGLYDGCLNRCPDFSSLDFASETVEDTDKELQRRTKEAEARILFLSEALEKESFLRDSGFAVSSLIQTVRHLMEEKINVTLEVLELLRSRIADRACARQELRMVRAEFELQTKKIEKEKHVIKLGLEKELDRRLKEQRLRERARELVEHNVSLQREVSTFNEKETRNRSIVTYSAEQFKSLSMKQKSITKLLRTCSEQEKMIEGLRQGYHDKIDKKKSGEKNEGKVKKLQMEQIRLTGVELSLRRELESCRLEVDSLRHENIDLWNSLNGTTNDIGGLTFKLDKEIQNRICCLQDQGLSMLNESTHLSSKLIEFIKGKAIHNQLRVTQQGLDGQFLIESDMKVWGFKRRIQNLARNLETISTLVHEKSSSVASNSHLTSMNPDVPTKLNKRSSEELTRTEIKTERLLTSLLREKLYSKELEVEQLQAEVSAAVRGNDILRCEVQNAMDNISCLTHRLKDLGLQNLKKIEYIHVRYIPVSDRKYFLILHVNSRNKQATTYRNRFALGVICVIWGKGEDDKLFTPMLLIFFIFLNMSMSNAHVIHVFGYGITKELAILRGVLPMVSQERDLTWEEVKQYAEKNMVLNSEINALKKIEGLDDDILLKEGQITILKDTLNNNNKSIDLLGSVDSISEFLLQ